MSNVQLWSDSPSQGAYQEHEIVSVLRQAIEDSVFMPFAKRESISSGNTITLPIRGRLAEPTSSLLVENISIPLQKLSITAKTIEMKERGRGVMFSEKAKSRSPIDLLSEHRMALSEQMSLDLDSVLSADGFQSGQLKYAPTGAASYNLATSGSFGAAALSNPNFYHIRKLRDLAYRTYLMPKLADGKYKYVSSTAGVRGILDDPEFLEINKNGNSSVFQKNLAGTIADVDIIEDNHTLADNVGTNTDVGEGVFIADEAVKYAMLRSPEIRYDATHDHGRFVSLAWVSDWGCGPSSDVATAGIARLIHVGST